MRAPGRPAGGAWTQDCSPRARPLSWAALLWPCVHLPKVTERETLPPSLGPLAPFDRRGRSALGVQVARPRGSATAGLHGRRRVEPALGLHTCSARDKPCRGRGGGAHRGGHFVPVCHEGTESFTKQGAGRPAGEAVT